MERVDCTPATLEQRLLPGHHPVLQGGDSSMTQRTGTAETGTWLRDWQAVATWKGLQQPLEEVGVRPRREQLFIVTRT